MIDHSHGGVGFAFQFYRGASVENARLLINHLSRTNCAEEHAGELIQVLVDHHSACSGKENVFIIEVILLNKLHLRFHTKKFNLINQRLHQVIIRPFVIFVDGLDSTENLLVLEH